MPFAGQITWKFGALAHNVSTLNLQVNLNLQISVTIMKTWAARLNTEKTEENKYKKIKSKEKKHKKKSRHILR